MTKSLWPYLAASPIALYLGLTDFGSRSFQPEDIWLLGVPVVFIGGIALVLNRARKVEEKKEIEIRYNEGVAVFRNYRFITKFSGDKVKDQVSVPFTGIYKSKVTRGKGGNVWLDLVTDHGELTIDSYTELPEIAEAFEEIIKLNKQENTGFSSDLDAVPTPQTPWYAWAILAVSVFVIAYISWSYLKNT